MNSILPKTIFITGATSGFGRATAKLFNDKGELESSLINQINLMIEKNKSKHFIQIENLTFEKEILKIDSEDYYHSNVIARASKTMNECKLAKINFKSTGTEG